MNHKIRRDPQGVPHVLGENAEEVYRAMGYCHAMDRGGQILFMRILAQGRASEILDSSDKMLEVDKFFRKMNPGEEEDLSKLSPSARLACEAYCDGINRYFARKSPLEFKWLGYKIEPWRVQDSLLISRMVAYVSLAQSQGGIEKLAMEMVQAGVDRERLEELFPGLLQELDIPLILKTNLGHRLLPPDLSGLPVSPQMASNNWVVSGKKTASGSPILSNDPHLETDRLPNVWYEIVLQMNERYVMGVSMPGLPGVLIGRTNDLAWGATYTFMDCVDSWVEHCKEGKYLKEGGWHPFTQRKETIRRKNRPSSEVIFYENEHGLLDGDPNQEGFYLSTSWSPARSGVVSLNMVYEMMSAQNVEQGMDLLGRLETSWNWVLADRHGNIGYQMSGLMPRRREGTRGFVPLPGWEQANDWKGFVPHVELPRCYNPERGYFCTANDDLNGLGKEKPINMTMGEYRSRRISALLEEKNDFVVQDMFPMHFDVYSIQAQEYLEILRPLLPDTPQGKILREWDCRYSLDSKGAYLFEIFYAGLLESIVGDSLGKKTVRYLIEHTEIVMAFHCHFDRIMLSEDSKWFGGKKREDIWRKVLEECLNVEPVPWGETRKILFKNIMMGQKFPKWFGFDRGPISLLGGRATIHQGQIYEAAGRTTTFAPSYRMVTDLGKDEIHTTIAGGPSDRRFSKWYCSELENWKNGQYKTIKCGAI